MNQITITKMKNKIIALIIFCAISACSLSPGIKEDLNIKNLSENNIVAKEISPALLGKRENLFSDYTVSIGDTLAVVVFGQDEFFPNQAYVGEGPYVKRIVNESGEIFFPYVGLVEAQGKTVSEIRKIITNGLSENFIEPQVDVSILDFNIKRNIYVLGEVRAPKTISLGLVPLNLSDALAEAKGLDPNTSKSSKIFVIRKQDEGGEIYVLDLKDPSKFILAGNFYLVPGDIVYVGAADITKWNRFISQLFPFASFLNQVEGINAFQ